MSLTAKLDDYSSMALTDEDIINKFVSFLQVHLGLTISDESKGGMNGYHESRKLAYTDDRPFKDLGFIAWGGNRGTYQLYLTGEGCEYIHMIEDGFDHIYDLAKQASMKIKRVDIAYDDFDGKLDLDLAISLYQAGEFRITRNPKIKQIGDFVTGHDIDGRTVYIGSRESGKMMRIYEKGKQLGDSSSPWVRWELELKAVDRVIPLDVLINPTEYYAGSYPALSNFKFCTSSKMIKTVKIKAKISMDKLIEYARNSYGKLFNVLAGKNTPEKILEILSRDGIPKRLIIPIPQKSKPQIKNVLSNFSLPRDSLEAEIIYSFH